MRFAATLAVAAAAAAFLAPAPASADCWQDQAAYHAKWKDKFWTPDHCARAYWYIKSAPHLKSVVAACSWEGNRAWNLQQVDAKVAWLVKESASHKCKRRY